MTYLKNVATLAMDCEKCIGCGMCLDVCPRDVFVMEEGKTRISRKDSCMECGACVMNCPVSALAVNKGVGCAEAVINGFLKGGEPSCGCSCGNNKGCC